MKSSLLFVVESLVVFVLVIVLAIAGWAGFITTLLDGGWNAALWFLPVAVFATISIAFLYEDAFLGAIRELRRGGEP